MRAKSRRQHHRRSTAIVGRALVAPAAWKKISFSSTKLSARKRETSDFGLRASSYCSAKHTGQFSDLSKGHTLAAQAFVATWLDPTLLEGTCSGAS